MQQYQKEYYLKNRDKIIKIQLDYCRKNKDKVRARALDYRHKNRDKMLDYQCKHYRKNKDEILVRHRKWRENNKDKIEESRRKYAPKGREKCRKRNRQLKIDVMSAYGGKCQCCGETIMAFLQIDHINGGGNKQRKEFKTGVGTTFYDWLKKNNYPSGFQVLCANCNVGKHINKGICPHKEKILEGNR